MLYHCFLISQVLYNIQVDLNDIKMIHWKINLNFNRYLVNLVPKFMKYKLLNYKFI